MVLYLLKKLRNGKSKLLGEAVRVLCGWVTTVDRQCVDDRREA